MPKALVAPITVAVKLCSWSSGAGGLEAHDVRRAPSYESAPGTDWPFCVSENSIEAAVTDCPNVAVIGAVSDAAVPPDAGVVAVTVGGSTTVENDHVYRRGHHAPRGIGGTREGRGVRGGRAQRGAGRERRGLVGRVVARRARNVVVRVVDEREAIDAGATGSLNRAVIVAEVATFVAPGNGERAITIGAVSNTAST